MASGRIPAPGSSGASRRAPRQDCRWRRGRPAYLDVCFFHPFADGNARSALLALAFILARDGVVLDQVGPITQVQRFADDVPGALGLANLVSALIEGTLRRAQPPRPHTGQRGPASRQRPRGLGG